MGLHMRCRTVWLAVVLSCLAPSVLAQSDWTLFSPTGGNFTISVPSSPTALPVERGTLNGKAIETILFRVQEGSLIYLCGWTEYNQRMNVKGELDADRDSFVKSVKGRLTGETRISQNGVAGREITAENDTAFFVSRIYVAGSRAWTIVVAVPKGAADDPQSVTRFLNSLQLKAPR